MARGDIRQRIRLEGGDQVRRELQSIGSAGDKAANDLRVALAGANVGLAALSNAAAGLRGSFAELAGFFGAAAGPLARMTGAVGALTTGMAGIPIAAGAAVAAMGLLAGAGARFASEIKDGAARIGTSAQNFVGFRFAVEQSGGSAEDFERAMSVILDESAKAEQAGVNTESASEKILAANRGIGGSFREVSGAYRSYSESLRDSTRRSETAITRSVAQMERQLQRQTRSIQEQANLRAQRAPTDEKAQEIEEQAQDDIKKLRSQFNEDIAELEERAAEDLAEQRREAQIKLNREIAEINRKAYEKWQDDLDAANRAREAEIDQHFSGQKNKFQEFGVALREAGKARDPTEVFREVAQKISEIPDPAERAARAVELFGRRAGPRLNQLLAEGAEGIDRLVDESRQLGLIPTQEAVELGETFGDTMDKISASATATTAKVGLEFARLFLPLGEAIAQAFGRAQGPIVQGAAAIREALQPIFDQIAKMIRGEEVDSAFLRALQTVAGSVGAAFNLAAGAVGAFLRVLSFSFEQIAALLREVFGAKVVAGDIPAFIAALFLASKAVGIFAFALQAVTAANPLLRLLSLIAIGIVALLPLIEEHWPAIQQRIAEIGQSLVGVGETINATLVNAIKYIADRYTEVATFINETTASIAEFFGKAFQAIQEAWQALWTWVGERISELLLWLDPLIQKLNTAVRLLSRLSGDSDLIQAPLGELVTPGAASGGRIVGPGTATSDSIWAWLSNGEYIVNAAATRIFLPLLEAINRSTAPRFAQGGRLDLSSLARGPRLPSPRFVPSAALAEGGGAPVHLHLDGREFMLRGERGVVDTLRRAARNRAIVSGGRPQSWKRA